MAMATMGYHAGLTGATRFFAIGLLTVALSAVIRLIADLDRPSQGLLQVSQRAMADVQRQIDRDSGQK
jgi:hypothetical protein